MDLCRSLSCLTSPFAIHKNRASLRRKPSEHRPMLDFALHYKNCRRQSPQDYDIQVAEMIADHHTAAWKRALDLDFAFSTRKMLRQVCWSQRSLRLLCVGRVTFCTGGELLFHALPGPKRKTVDSSPVQSETQGRRVNRCPVPGR